MSGHPRTHTPTTRHSSLPSPHHLLGSWMDCHQATLLELACIQHPITIQWILCTHTEWISPSIFCSGSVISSVTSPSLGSRQNFTLALSDTVTSNVGSTKLNRKLTTSEPVTTHGARTGTRPGLSRRSAAILPAA